MCLPECQQPPVKAYSKDAPDRPPMRGGRCMWRPHLFLPWESPGRTLAGGLASSREQESRALWFESQQPASVFSRSDESAVACFFLRCQAMATAVAVARAASCGTQRASQTTVPRCAPPWDPLGMAHIYLYRPEGIFSVPQYYIERDRNMPIMVTPKTWKEAQSHHQAFGAVNFLAHSTVRAENIVVMSLLDPQSPHGRFKRCHWFLRIAIDNHAGASFLWQLPYRTCTKIVSEIIQYEKANKVPANQGSSLVRHLKATAQDLKVKDWPDLEPVTVLNGYYDKLFVMCLKPVKYTIARPKDNPKPTLARLNRPLCLQTQKKSRLNFSRMPDDAVLQILKTAASQWTKSHDTTDWSALLALRATSSTAKAVVNDAVTRFLTSIITALKANFASGIVDDLLKTRDCILDAGLTTMELLRSGQVQVKDSKAPSFLMLGRLRMNRKPDATPPMTRTEIQVVLDRVNARNRADSDDEKDGGAEESAFQVRNRFRKKILGQ